LTASFRQVSIGALDNVAAKMLYDLFWPLLDPVAGFLVHGRGYQICVCIEVYHEDWKRQTVEVLLERSLRRQGEMFSAAAADRMSVCVISRSTLFPRTPFL
jgi:hypothetical protein